MAVPGVRVYRERYYRRVAGDLPEDLEPEDWDILGVMKARVARSFAVQPAPPRGTPAWGRTPHFNMPASPPSSRPVSLAGERSFHLGVNKPAKRPARSFDRYAASKGAIVATIAVGEESVQQDGASPAAYDTYAIGHGGGAEQVPDHYTNLSLDPDVRAAQWDAIEAHERSLRVHCEPGPPRLAIFYERAPDLFDHAASLARCPEGLRRLIAKEQGRVAAGKPLPPRKQQLGVEWIDDGARAAHAWLASLPGWDVDTDPARRLSRLSEGRGVLTHVSGEIEYPAALAGHPDARRNIRIGIAVWLNDQPGRDGDGDDPGIVPVALFDHLPDRLNDRRNTHCHFIFGTRRVTVADDGSLAFGDHKVDAITRKGFVERLRTKFAELANIELTRIGADHRLHPGTHAEMGIDGTTPNQKLFGRAVVLERAGVPTAHGISSDFENWRRRFERACARRDARLGAIDKVEIGEAARAMLRSAALLRHEAEEIGLFIGMTVGRAKRTARFATAYADAAKRQRDRDGWLERGREAQAHLALLASELAEERRAVVSRRREAARLEREALALAQREHEAERVAAQTLSASHRVVDTIARTPLLLTERDGMFVVEPRDDPERLVAEIDLSAPAVQRRLAAQHAAQRKALAQVRAFIDRHGYDAMFDDQRIGRSAWMRGAIEQWRSSPLLEREERARRERAAAHRAMLLERQRSWRGRDEQDIDELVEDGRIRLLPETPFIPHPAPAPEVIEATSMSTVPQDTDQPAVAENVAVESGVEYSAPPPAAPVTAAQAASPEEDVWPRWRPGGLRPIPGALIDRWRTDGKDGFAADIAGFEHVLAARPERHAITDWPLGDALGADAVWLSDPVVSQRLTAIWLYQQMTRDDLIAARLQPHIILDPAPPPDPANALSHMGVMADRARHGGDQRLVAMFHRVDGGKLVSPPAQARANRLVRTALAAIRAGEDAGVCRLLADAAIAQPAWRALADTQIAEPDVAALWSASIMPGKGIHRRARKAGRRRGYPALSPPHQPGRGRS